MKKNTANSTELPKSYPNLFNRAVKGGFWVLALRITQQLLSVARIAVLARLLALEDFGLMGIAMLMMVSPPVRRWFHRMRDRYPSLDRRLSSIEPHLPVSLQKVLRPDNLG